jgi:predicted AlkP superfamily phosphohydrolase/phosphomutase
MNSGNWRWLMILAVVFLVGCGGGGQKAETADADANKLLVIGIDSADWRLLKPMMEEGRLPHLAEFMTQSTHGRMKTFYPLEKSPLLWASICTGVLPEVHGINYFVKGEDQQPVKGSAWFAPAIWDILGAADRSTSLVGMWTTYPARPINGVMISDYVPYGSNRDKPLAGLCYPDSLAEWVVSQRVDPTDITDEQLSYFIPADQLAMAKETYSRDVEKLKGVLAADLTYLAINRELAKGDKFDLFFFYLRGPDMISHYFYKYMDPDKGHYRHTPEALAAFSGVVKKYYDWSDEVTGEVLGWFPSDRQTVILSDHGFYGPRKSSEKGAAEHSEWGIFLVRSSMYEADQSFKHLELLDICPTFLALMGLPPAKDMPGFILDQGLTEEGRKRVIGMEDHRVETYLPLRPAAGPEGELDEGVNEEIRKQLRSLGYIN